MTEKLLQMLRLLLCVCACYGYMRLWMRRFCLEAEFALPVSLAALGFAMFLAALAGLALPGALALLGLGLACALHSLFRREGLRCLCRPGVLFFALGAAVSFVLLYGSELNHGDNYSHWGAILRMILRLDALPAHDPLVYFPAYPTGSSLLLYWFSRLSGIRAEWLWAWAQSLLQLACAAPLFCFVRAEKRGERLLFTGLTFAVALSLLCGNTDPVDLLVDTLVPLLGLAGVLLYFRGRETGTGVTVPLLILTAYLPTVKNSGYFFALLLVLLALAEGEGRDRLRQPALLLLGVAAVNRAWAFHVKRAFEGGLGSYHAMSLESFGKSLAEKDAGDLAVILRAFLAAVWQEGRLFWLLLALGAVLWLCGKQRPLRRRCLLVGGAWLLYLVCLLGMYAFSMSVEEARGVAAFDRYYRSAALLCAGCLWVLALRALPRITRGRAAAAVLACAVLIGLCAPNFRYLLPQSRRMDATCLLRRRFDAVILKNRIPEEQNYLLLTDPENEMFSRVLCTYLLRPTSTLVCVDPALLEEDLGRTDYYIVLDAECAAARALCERYGAQAPAGWNGALPALAEP